MKYFLAITALLMLPHAAMAQKAKEKELPAGMGSAAFLQTYLHCDKLKDPDFVKSLDKQDCRQKVNLQFCSLLKELPVDVQQNISLEVYCNFLGGEQSRDKETDTRIMESARDAGCFAGHEPRLALYKKYKENADVQDALQNYTKSLLANEALCYANTTPSAEENAQ